jgi:hypothetical protein
MSENKETLPKLLDAFLRGGILPEPEKPVAWRAGRPVSRAGFLEEITAARVELARLGSREIALLEPDACAFAAYLLAAWSLKVAVTLPGDALASTRNSLNMPWVGRSLESARGVSANDKRQTTNDKQQTTNNKQQTTNNKPQPTHPLLPGDMPLAVYFRLYRNAKPDSQNSPAVAGGDRSAGERVRAIFFFGYAVCRQCAASALFRADFCRAVAACFGAAVYSRAVDVSGAPSVLA